MIRFCVLHGPMGGLALASASCKGGFRGRIWAAILPLDIFTTLQVPYRHSLF